LGPIPNPQSPIPNPQSPMKLLLIAQIYFFFLNLINTFFNLKKIFLGYFFFQFKKYDMKLKNIYILKINSY
jgi:hypothetical protein